MTMPSSDMESADMEKGSMPSPTTRDVIDQGKEEVGSIASFQNTELKQSFNLWSCLGIQYSISATPIAIATYLSFVIGVGGSPFFIYGYIVAVSFNLCICFSLAEVAAVFPHATGQVYWAQILFPKKHARGASYVAGWLASMGWFLWAAGTFLLTSQLTWALVQVCHLTFVIQPWHYYMGYLAYVVVGFLLNWPLFKLFPYMTKGLVALINAGALFIFLCLLIRTHPKQSASFVFADILNYTGWSSDGVVFFLGLLPGLSSVTGFDGASHMADELPEPKRRVPQVMIGSAVLGAVSGFAMIIALMFCIVNEDNLLAPVGGQPIVQLMLDSLDSMALTIIGTLFILFTYIGGAAAVLTTFTRVWWSFAREGGLPFASFFAKVDETWHLPVNTISFCSIICALIGLIELGSLTALNAILGGGSVCILSSYGIVIVGVLVNKREAFPVTRYCNLGRLGFGLNIISVVWIAFIFVWLCFPLYLPVTAASMNYASVIIAAVYLIMTVNWFASGRRTYTGVPTS